MSRFRRGRHLLVEWKGKTLVLIDCNTLVRFRVDARLVDLLSAMDEWRKLRDLEEAGYAVSATDLERLVEAGVVEREGQLPAHSSSQPENYWNPFDLAVHRQSNFGGYSEAVVRARNMPPPALFKERTVGLVTRLPEPEPLNVSLQEVLANRRTIRTYGKGPLRLRDLASLLRHAFRVGDVVRDGFLGDHAFRVFPAGGARCELELYVVANDVAGLMPGAYYYDARAHDLRLVVPRDDGQCRLNAGVHAATAGTLNREPPAILLITAVFARIMWKYTGIGLGVIYKNTGCLYQTLYLIATSLNLAPCAIGAGQELANSRWLGLDPLIESQVGCMLIGPKE